MKLGSSSLQGNFPLHHLFSFSDFLSIFSYSRKAEKFHVTHHILTSSINKNLWSHICFSSLLKHIAAIFHPKRIFKAITLSMFFLPALNDLLLLLQEQKHCLYRPRLIWNVIWCGILIIVCCSVVKWGIYMGCKKQAIDKMRWEELDD